MLLWAGSGTLAGVPASVLIAAVLFGAWWFLLTRTVVGRWFYAIGGNAAAAAASLVPVRLVGILTYVLAGVSAGVGAIITIGRLGSAQPLAGTGLEFTAITAAIIGGTSLAGGEGTVTGTVLGALLLGAINNGLSFLQVSQQMIYVVTGGLMLFAVLLSRRERCRRCCGAPCGTTPGMPQPPRPAARRPRIAPGEHGQELRAVCPPSPASALPLPPAR